MATLGEVAIFVSDINILHYVCAGLSSGACPHQRALGPCQHPQARKRACSTAQTAMSTPLSEKIGLHCGSDSSSGGCSAPTEARTGSSGGCSWCSAPYGTVFGSLRDGFGRPMARIGRPRRARTPGHRRLGAHDPQYVVIPAFV